MAFCSRSANKKVLFRMLDIRRDGPHTFFSFLCFTWKSVSLLSELVLGQVLFSTTCGSQAQQEPDLISKRGSLQETGPT